MIREYYYQQEKPEALVNDSRGVKIQTGLRVAFNKSGTVVLGTIKEIKKNRWKNRTKSKTDWILDFEMKVENENGDISTVKNPNSFVII